MKVLLSLALILLWINSASAEEVEFVPEVDVSTIVSWDDYYTAKNASWMRYYDRKNKAFNTYYDQKNVAFGEYHDFKMMKLMELRSSNFDAYIQWLDAREIGDYQRRMKLERTVPELAQYVAAEAERYKQYVAEEEALRAAYLAAEVAARENHEREEEMARKAYESHMN